MSYPFNLPTTGSISFTTSHSCSAFPTLPFAATTKRAVLRDSLKRHKRLSATEQVANLVSLVDIANDYLPYLYALSSQPNDNVNGRFQCEWRPTLSKRIVGVREQPRAKLFHLEHEIRFVITTLAYIHILRGNSYFYAAISKHESLSDTSNTQSATDAASTSLNQAISNLLIASSIFSHLLQNVSTQPTSEKGAHLPVDITADVFGALQKLCMASATILAVYRSDPYPSIIAVEHDKSSKEWMYKAPTVPTGVKALLLARICIEASDLAGQALASLNLPGVTERLDSQLKSYCEDLQRTGRAKACRFIGVDAEAQGKVGEAIGWVRAGSEILGTSMTSNSENTGGGSGGSTFSKGLDKLKRAREDKKAEKRSAETGMLLGGDDAGRFEESKVLAALEKKWVKTNDSVTFQTIKPASQLLTQLPSGRPVHTEPPPWVVPKLEPEVWSQMRHQATENDQPALQGDQTVDSSDEEEDINPGREDIPGGFPASRAGYY